MNCRHTLRRLSNHLEGRLSPQEAGAVAAHLHACPSCRRFRDDLLAAEAWLAGPADPLPPPGIERRAVRLWQRERGDFGFRVPSGRLDFGLGPTTAGLSLTGYPLAGADNPKSKRPEGTRNPKSHHRSPLHMAVLVAAMLLAILALELPAAGGRYSSQAPCRLTQGIV